MQTTGVLPSIIGITLRIDFTLQAFRYYESSAE
jgi:hypothetical protein